MKTAVKISYDTLLVLPNGALGMNVVQALEQAYIVTGGGYGDSNYKRSTDQQLEIGFYPDDKFPDEEEDYKQQLVKAQQEVSKYSGKQYALNRQIKEQQEELDTIKTKLAQLLPEPPVDLEPAETV